MRALLWLVIGAAAADYTCDVSPAALEQIVARASATLGGDYVVAHGVWNWPAGQWKLGHVLQSFDPAPSS